MAGAMGHFPGSEVQLPVAQDAPVVTDGGDPDDDFPRAGSFLWFAGGAIAMMPLPMILILVAAVKVNRRQRQAQRGRGQNGQADPP